MGQVLHGSARMTEAIRRAIQLRQESVRAAAKRSGVSRTTIQKWRRRQSTADAVMGPKEPRSTVLTAEDESIELAELYTRDAEQEQLAEGGMSVWEGRATR